MKPEGLFPCSQETATGHCPKSVEFTPRRFLKIHLNSLLSTHLRLGRQSGLFSSGFRTKLLYSFGKWDGP